MRRCAVLRHRLLRQLPPGLSGEGRGKEGTEWSAPDYYRQVEVRNWKIMWVTHSLARRSCKKKHLLKRMNHTEQYRDFTQDTYVRIIRRYVDDELKHCRFFCFGGPFGFGQTDAILDTRSLVTNVSSRIAGTHSRSRASNKPRSTALDERGRLVCFASACLSPTRWIFRPKPCPPVAPCLPAGTVAIVWRTQLEMFKDLAANFFPK